MEFKFDIKDLAELAIVKIDHTLKPVGYDEEDEKYIRLKILAYTTYNNNNNNFMLNNYNLFSLQGRIAMIIDEMGKASARAQELKTPITTADKLSKSDNIIYLMSEQINEEYVHRTIKSNN